MTPSLEWIRTTSLLTVICFLGRIPTISFAAPPRYDHVVIVIEENRAPEQIMGDLTNAPYINSLAKGGVWLKSMFAIEHPSQPNYLQLFSGSNQGVLDDNLPPNYSSGTTSTYPFRTPNLGASLLGAGLTFAGYSEQIEAAGSADWASFNPLSGSIYYRRKHNPWANWIAKGLTASTNQLHSTVNRAFNEFPADFTQLPTVSFVVPNQQHDMHDGSRRMGDDWLRDHLNPYAVWARTNNSLLIITWDEDDYGGANRILTVLHGANLRNGTVVEGTWTHHNLLRTIEDMYGLATHAGAAALVRPIIGPFVTDPVMKLATFRQGLGGYTGASDTMIWQQNAATNYARFLDLTVDLDTSTAAGNQVGQALVRFDNLIGNGPNQVPDAAVVHSAKLLLHTPSNGTTTDFASEDRFRLHRMLVNWDDNATWNSLTAGVSLDGAEAAINASFSLVPDVDNGPAIFDVTADIELFRTGTPNRGWVIVPPGSGYGDGWTFKSSEYTSNSSLRPTLEVVYSLRESPYAVWASSFGLAGADASPTADPDQDGADNLTEFAHNLDPRLADARPIAPTDTNGFPTARFLSDVSNGILEVQFLGRKGPSAAGLAYKVEFSGDLVEWSSGVMPVVTSLGADWERVIVRDSIQGPQSSRFARILLTLQP